MLFVPHWAQKPRPIGCQHHQARLFRRRKDTAQDNSLAEWYGTGAMNIYEDGRIYRSVRSAAKKRVVLEASVVDKLPGIGIHGLAVSHVIMCS